MTAKQYSEQQANLLRLFAESQPDEQEVSNVWGLRFAHWKRGPAVDGTCCSCGYNGEEETECTAREDQTHCVHWWDGEPDAVQRPT